MYFGCGHARQRFIATGNMADERQFVTVRSLVSLDRNPFSNIYKLFHSISLVYANINVADVSQIAFIVT